MTNKEAISNLNRVYGVVNIPYQKSLDIALKALEGQKIEPQGNDCEGCKHDNKASTDYPCNICKHNHPNMFEWLERK